MRMYVAGIIIGKERLSGRAKMMMRRRMARHVGTGWLRHGIVTRRGISAAAAAAARRIRRRLIGMPASTSE